MAHQLGQRTAGAQPAEFRPEAAASDFEVQRAVGAYIPLLEACYAKAQQRPFAFPPGYEHIAEIRASLTQMAEAAAAEPHIVQQAVLNDAAAAAAEAALADPASFGFIVRETQTAAVLVCIRGTQTPREWLHNFTAVPDPFSLVPDFGRVHLGFERMHASVRQSITAGLAGVPAATRITIAGHSLGGAIGLLAAVDLKRNFNRTNIDVCTVGGPRVGQSDFRRGFNAEIAKCFRVTNQFDIVPHVPSLTTGWNHVGEAIEVPGSVENAHSLEAYLQGLRNIGRMREARITGVVVEAAAAGVLSVRVP